MSKENFIKLITNVFWVCLGFIFFSGIFNQSFFGLDLTTITLLGKIINNLNNIQYGIVILAVICGGLIFYTNREKIESIEKEQENK